MYFFQKSMFCQFEEKDRKHIIKNICESILNESSISMWILEVYDNL